MIDITQPYLGLIFIEEGKNIYDFNDKNGNRKRCDIKEMFDYELEGAYNLFIKIDEKPHKIQHLTTYIGIFSREIKRRQQLKNKL